MERKNLVLIVAGAFAALLTVVIVLIFLNQPKTEPVAKPTTQATETTGGVNDPDSSNANRNPDDGAPIKVDEKDKKEGDVPPADIYANDYSKDQGYAPLPKDFVPTDQNTKDTVYDETWALTKYNVLLCELSNKETSTEKAIQPLKDFANDLAKATHPNAQQLRDSIYFYLKDYEAVLGQRAPADTRNNLSQACGADDLDKPLQ